MAKIELDHKDIRMILEGDEKLFAEVKGNIIASALKNVSRIKLDSLTQEYIKSERDAIMVELGASATKGLRLPKFSETALGRDLVGSYRTDMLEQFKNEVVESLNKQMDELRKQLENRIEVRAAEISGLCEKYIENKINKGTAATIEKEINERLAKIKSAL